MTSMLIILPATLCFWLGSFPTLAMGSHCIWPSVAGACNCSFFGFVPCFPNSFWSIHVASRDDFWIWAGFHHNYGGNNDWDGPAVFNWFNLSRQNSCKSETLSL